MSANTKTQTPLIIKPQGEIAPWRFNDGSSYGKAEDSLGIMRPSSFRGKPGFIGLALTREDAVLLRKFIEQCEKRWMAQGWFFDATRSTRIEATKELEQLEQAP